MPTCPLREEKSLSQRAFSIYTDIRKLQDKAKTSYITLPSGTHQIVITDKEGNIIGHCPLIIVKSDENKLTLTVDENGDYVIKPRNDTKTIDLTLTVDEDGNVAVKNAADATVHSGTSPTTGDNSNLTMWYILMLVSAGIAFAVLITNRRRKVIE